MHSYKYPHPAVTVDVIVTAGEKDQLAVLLIRRRSEPFKDKWALPGGFMNIDETLADACKRELKEETGLKGIALEQLNIFDAPGRDPRERVISVVFYAHLSEAPGVSGSDDAREAKWFPLISLPELAFDHKEIIGKFIREKLE